jgi:CBS-domain-containing membrane protein
MQVKDVMTPNVICIGANEPVLKAARLMLQNRISGLPVIDKDGELVGIVTEGDFCAGVNWAHSGGGRNGSNLFSGPESSHKNTRAVRAERSRKL